MTRSEFKSLKPGDIVYGKKDGCAYEFIKVQKFSVVFGGVVYDLLLKPYPEGEPVYINSKKIKK